jgi:hypothetical protein
MLGSIDASYELGSHFWQHYLGPLDLLSVGWRVEAELPALRRIFNRSLIWKMSCYHSFPTARGRDIRAVTVAEAIQLAPDKCHEILASCWQMAAVGRAEGRTARGYASSAEYLRSIAHFKRQIREAQGLVGADLS